MAGRLAGWTSHGHRIDGLIQIGKPETVARCGGPGLCARCSGEAARAKPKPPEYVPRHRADKAPLGEDVTGHTLGPHYVHDDDRECAYHNRLRLWVCADVERDTFVECLRTDHPERTPVTREMPGIVRQDPPRGMTRERGPIGFQRGSEGGCYS